MPRIVDFCMTCGGIRDQGATRQGRSDAHRRLGATAPLSGSGTAAIRYRGAREAAFSFSMDLGRVADEGEEPMKNGQ